MNELKIPLSQIDYFVGIVYAIAVFLGCWRMTRSLPDRHWVRIAFITKIISCFLFANFMFIYYDGGDCLGFHDHGIIYANLLRHDLRFGTYNFWTSDPFFMLVGNNTVRCRSLSGFVHVLAFDSFMASSVLFSTLGFWGQCLFFRAFIAYYPNPNLRSFWIIGNLFLPSVVFWSAGLLKDPIGLWGLGILFYSIIMSIIRPSMCRFGGVVIGTITLLLFRNQVIPVFFPAILPLILIKPKRIKTKNKFNYVFNAIFTVLIIITIFTAFIYIVMLDRRLSVDQVSQSMFDERGRYANTRGSSTIKDSSLIVAKSVSKKTVLLIDMFCFTPEAIMTALFRPYFWEGFASPILFLASLENTILMCLIVCYMFKVVRTPYAVSKLMHESLWFSCIIFVFFFSIAIGISTPNLGTISRYRMPVMPFFIGIVGIMRWSLLSNSPSISKVRTCFFDNKVDLFVKK